MISAIKKYSDFFTLSVFVPLRLTAAASAADAGIHKNFWSGASGSETTLISIEEMKSIIRIVKPLEDV